MKRLLNVVGSVLGLLIVGLLILALSMSYRGSSKDTQPASSAFKSPIQSPTPRPGATPTPRAGLSSPPISKDLAEPIQLTTRSAGRSGLAADGDIIVWQESDPDRNLLSIVAYDLRSRAERIVKSLPPGGKDTQRSFASGSLGLLVAIYRVRSCAAGSGDKYRRLSHRGRNAVGGCGSAGRHVCHPR